MTETLTCRWFQLGIVRFPTAQQIASIVFREQMNAGEESIGLHTLHCDCSDEEKNNVSSFVLFFSITSTYFPLVHQSNESFWKLEVENQMNIEQRADPPRGKGFFGMTDLIRRSFRLSGTYEEKSQKRPESRSSRKE